VLVEVQPRLGILRFDELQQKPFGAVVGAALANVVDESAVRMTTLYFEHRWDVKLA
jgi:hypothetical protein